MATTTQVSAVESPVRGRGAHETYEGIQLETRDWDKMITFIDQLLFHLRVTQTKARPVAIRESKGVVEIRWQGRVPKAFRPGRYGLLCISRGRWMDSFTVQRAA